MLRRMRLVFAVCAASAAFLLAVRSGCAGTIIELNLEGDPTIEIDFDGSLLSTPGPQATAVNFVGFLEGLPDIPTTAASFTLEGLTAAGPATVLGTLVIQQFTGGSFSLYAPSSTLLLSGDLSPSGFAGTIGQPDGTLFTTSFSTVTGGSLAGLLDPNSLVLQMHMWDVNDGAGFTVIPTGPATGEIQPFTGGVTVDIGGEIPEPTSIVLIVTATLAAISGWRRGQLR